MSQQKALHVAVAVIKNSKDELLISLRHDKAHQGGLWEFPGGKVEQGETVEQALARELKEELDISVQAIQPLIKINHQYTDLNVLLDVWTVTEFSGLAKGCEGQQIKWITKKQLSEYTFPAANYPIISAVKLPTDYAILNGAEESVLLANLNTILDKGIKLVQARVKSLPFKSVEPFLIKAKQLCKAKGAVLLLNSAVKGAENIMLEGLHLTSKDLMTLKQRPAGFKWVAASCHNQGELKQAEKIGLDFVVLAPVLKTKTHPDTEPLGWSDFKNLVLNVNLPVFALGGLNKADKDKAQTLGAQGMAGISAYLA